MGNSRTTAPAAAGESQPQEVGDESLQWLDEQTAAGWPTEAEAEVILREHGTSGKEVVNSFINQLLRERQQFKDDADSHLRIASDIARSRDAIDLDRRGWHERYLTKRRELGELREAVAVFVRDRGQHKGQHVFDLTVCHLCDESYGQAEAALESTLELLIEGEGDDGRK